MDWVAGDPATVRATYTASRRLFADDAAPDVTISDVHDGSLLFEPRAVLVPDATVVYFHGGGFMAGSPETHRVPVSHLARLTGLRVVSAPYGLAPENRFPRQREDGVAAIARALADTARVVLAGDSAGAAVAFWAEAALAPSLRRRVAGIVAFYGAYGLTESASISELGTETSGLGRASLLAMYRRLGTVPPPLAHTAFGEGPPCHLIGAELDPLRDDTMELHSRLRQAGRRATLTIAAGLPHGFLHFVGRVDSARAALVAAARDIRALAESRPS